MTLANLFLVRRRLFETGRVVARQGLALMAMLAATFLLGGAARAVVILPEGANPRGLAEGELLLGELNCTACHSASPAVLSRLQPRVAPLLDGIGSRVTASFLRSFLSAPEAVKPGCAMPDMLHGLEAAKKSEVVDALVHYLVDERGPESGEIQADDAMIRQGRLLYHQVGCVACHSPEESVAAVFSRSSQSGAAPALNSVPLGDLARKYSIGQLAAFLDDPVKWRPSGRMPSMNLSAAESKAIATYLLRAQVRAGASSQAARVPGLEYAYYEHEISDDFSNIDSLKPTLTGVVDNFDLSPRKRGDQVGFVFKGSILIPADGSYLFATTSDDGSMLYVDGNVVVKNDGTHSSIQKAGRARLTAGEHSIRVLYFNGGGELELKVFIQGPGLSQKEIPSAMLSHRSVPTRPLDLETVVPDPAKVAAGRGYFVAYGCASCHRVGGAEPPPAGRLAKGFSELDPDHAAGCLADAPGEKAPLFSLSSGQKAALRQILGARETLQQPLSSAERAEKLMVVYSCYSCHSRGNAGGPQGPRTDYFRVVGQVDLGDEGRIPPHLTRVGFKLRPEWMIEVLWRGAAVRPYMATRMPQYGAANLRDLPSLLAEADKMEATGVVQHPADDAARKAGRKLAGVEGLSCVSCHTFGGHASLGIPAMDMTVMARRLNPAWFHQYLLDPASLRPGTRMPSFWPERKSMKPEILNGDTDAQVDAIWSYLSDGAAAKLPEGMTRAALELVATNEPVIYRNFIEGAGSRAIGVGYPEKADLAFDANNMALVMVWHGKFIDAARHRTGRGEGFEPPLGDDVVQLGSFPPFAILADPKAAWPKLAGKEAGYRMRGYVLDEKRRPKFLYSYKGIQIEDYPIPTRVADDPVLRREIRLEARGPEAQLYFLAVRSPSIVPKNEGSFVVDGKVTVKLESGGAGTAFVRTSGGISELVVPVTFLGGQAAVKEEFSW